MSKAQPFISESSSAQDTPREPAVTRRQLLRTLTAGGAALVGGAALAACGGTGSTTTTTNVTFYTATWPTDAMPTQADIKKDPTKKVYADTLQKWLKQNPGVTIKHSTLNIWDTPGLTSAVTAGTAPTWYMGDILGAFGKPATINAYLRGLAADVTSLVAKYNIDKMMTSYALPAWKSWQINSKYYGIPAGYGAGNGVFYRRDLLQQAGLQDPTTSWTWNDFRTYAKALTKGKTKGVALPGYAFGELIISNQLASGAGNYTNIGLVPSPNTSWHWRVDLTPKLDEYKQLTALWRGMYFDDKSVLADSTGGGDQAAQFMRGDAAMFSANTSVLTRSPNDPDSVTQIARRLNKPLEEVVGWVALPNGTNGAFGATQSNLVLGCVDPHLQRNPAALAKAFDFLVYMIIGQGAIDQIIGLWNSTHDLQQVYGAVGSIPAFTNNMITFPGIPGTVEDAWGKKMVQAVQAAAQIPFIPDSTQYLPPEKNTTPTNNAFNDAFSGMEFAQRDVTPLITNLEKTVNQQLTTLTSSASASEFTQGAKNYYAALNTFWQKEAPNFYANEYQAWYQQKIVPALGG
ncbi:MAG TPA: extracellular solute-binding protein [Ktedonobacteraceae bacterium]|nr:extracellular solute-binding protein [Ktedonobacteraceae bacterium]